MNYLMFVMVAKPMRINHQLIIVVVVVDHLMMIFVVEKRNLFHQNHFHLMLL
jgi:hypothetical protein